MRRADEPKHNRAHRGCRVEIVIFIKIGNGPTNYNQRCAWEFDPNQVNNSKAILRRMRFPYAGTELPISWAELLVYKGRGERGHLKVANNN